MSAAEKTTPLIYSLIPKIMAEVGAIGKNGVNDYDKYKFRSIDDVYNKLQPVLAKNGVFFVPNVTKSEEERIQSQQGKSQVRVKLTVEYKIFASDGSDITATVEGEAVDRSDKATNKALTAAFKYLLIQVFCIAVEGMDDADKESPGLSFVQEKKAPAPAPVKNHAPKKKAAPVSQPQDALVVATCDYKDHELMAKLKELGFRWSKEQKAWWKPYDKTEAETYDFEFSIKVRES